MIISIDLADEEVARLREAAARRGQDTVDFVKDAALERARTLPAEDAAAEKDLPFHATATPEEWVRSFREWAESHRGRNLSSVSLEAMRRVSMHADQGDFKSRGEGGEEEEGSGF